MIDSRFAILGALITLGGNLSYARDTLKAKAQPNRVSWALWALAPLIAFAAELAQQVGLAALLTLAAGGGPLLVLVASFVDPKAYWAVTGLDVFCGCLAVVALIGWIATGVGDVAICFSILSDLFAAIPTIRKAYLHPKSESASAFVGSAIGAAVTLLTIKPHAWTFASYGFPLWIVLGCSIISALILGPRPDATAGPTKR
jgi:hypothetical protein